MYPCAYFLISLFSCCLSQLIESEILEILMVFSKDNDPDMSMVKACAERALETAVELNLIKENDDQDASWWQRKSGQLA